MLGILLNSVPLFDGTIWETGSISSFDLTVNAAAGDYLDFAVGFGSNHDFSFDSTGLAAQITTPVPEPSTIIAGALCLLPFGLHAVRSLRSREQERASQ